MYVHDPLTHQIIGCGIEVHRYLGPGLLEVTYERAFCIELEAAGLPYVRQSPVPVLYKGHLIGEHRPDLVVGGVYWSKSRALMRSIQCIKHRYSLTCVCSRYRSDC